MRAAVVNSDVRIVNSDVRIMGHVLIYITDFYFVSARFILFFMPVY
jgi:hypothetical protein